MKYISTFKKLNLTRDIKSAKKPISKLTFVGILLLLIGLAGFTPSVYYWQNNRQITHAAVNDGPVIDQPTVTAKPEAITGKPDRLVIPSLKLDLAVADGIHNPRTGQWTLSNDKVHYALITVEPNDQEGNTLIYGHYRPGVFATLRKIKPGEQIKVHTTNKNEFTYTFTGSKVVDPSDGTVFEYSGKPMMTLQTCTGAFMQNRQLFSFDLTAVNGNLVK